MNSDFINLLLEIEEHAKNNGKNIHSDDSPKSQEIGWICKNTNKIWRFKIRKFQEEYKEKKIDIFFAKCLMTREGKEQLVFLLNNGGSNKINNLKAFL